MMNSYLTFEIVIRVCIELRLHVPVDFAGIEIPSGIFLVISDLMLLLLVVSANESMIMRLEFDHGFRHGLYMWFIGMSCTAVVLLGIAERVYAIVSGVKWGFAWNKPDWVNYALVRILYCSISLGLVLFSLATAFVVLVTKNRHIRKHGSADLCGKVSCATRARYLTDVTQIPTYNLLFLAPALVTHSASAFYFAYFFHYQQKPQPPHLELVRMTFVCLPVIVVMVGAWQAKREDVRMRSGLKMQHQDDQTEYMLERRSMDIDAVPAYDAFGQKVADVFEAPVVSSPRERMWAPHGQNWNDESHGYENTLFAPSHEGLDHITSS